MLANVYVGNEIESCRSGIVTSSYVGLTQVPLIFWQKLFVIQLIVDDLVAWAFWNLFAARKMTLSF